VTAVRVTLVIRGSYDFERAPSVTSVVKLLKFLFNLHRLKINIIYLYINIGYDNIGNTRKKVHVHMLLVKRL